MANIVPPSGGVTEQSFDWVENDAAEEIEDAASEGAATDQKRGTNVKKAGKDEKVVRTVISFDKGGVWSYLKPPRVDSLGNPYECAGKSAEDCSLHLHGTTSWDFYAPFYSSETAVGIIMGTGNVGNSLRFEADQTSTYLSRDG